MKPIRITVDTTNLRGRDTPLLFWDDRQVAPHQAALEVCRTMRHVTAVILTGQDSPAGVIRINIPAMSGGDHLADAIESPAFKAMVSDLCDEVSHGTDPTQAAEQIAEIERLLASEVTWGECMQIQARGEAQYELARERLRAKGIPHEKLSDTDTLADEIKLMLHERMSQLVTNE